MEIARVIFGQTLCLRQACGFLGTTLKAALVRTRQIRKHAPERVNMGEERAFFRRRGGIDAIADIGGIAALQAQNVAEQGHLARDRPGGPVARGAVAHARNGLVHGAMNEGIPTGADGLSGKMRVGFERVGHDRALLCKSLRNGL